MAIDLEKLAPAPWHYGDERGHNETEDAFIALARNAFDVMQRRGWFAIPLKGQWYAACEPDDCGVSMTAIKPLALFPDPFTALVEADKWYKENVEKA